MAELFILRKEKNMANLGILNFQRYIPSVFQGRLTNNFENRYEISN